MQLLNRPCSADLFFTLFEAVRQVEKGEDGVTRYRWVSPQKRNDFQLFDTYSELVKKFKGDFFYVVPVNKTALAEVVCYDAAGKIEATQFYFDWSYDTNFFAENQYLLQEGGPARHG